MAKTLRKATLESVEKHVAFSYIGGAHSNQCCWCRLWLCSLAAHQRARTGCRDVGPDGRERQSRDLKDGQSRLERERFPTGTRCLEPDWKLHGISCFFCHWRPLLPIEEGSCRRGPLRQRWDLKPARALTEIWIPSMTPRRFFQVEDKGHLSSTSSASGINRTQVSTSAKWAVDPLQ